MAERRGKKSKSVPKLSAEAKADVMEAFHLFAHDDEVSASQLRLVLQGFFVVACCAATDASVALGIVVTEEESETLLSAHDPDGTEALGADAVVTVYREQLALRDKDAEVDQGETHLLACVASAHLWATAWQIFDVEGRGFITKEDLQVRPRARSRMW